MPAYNVEAYVDAAIRSVLDQTCPVHELIVIDDGSSDGTAAVLQAYASHSLVRLVYQENCGLGPSRNRGAGLATGNYIYFFDADDVLDSSFVKTLGQQVAECRLFPDVLFFSGHSFVDGHCIAPFTTDYQRPLEERGISGGQAFACLFQDGLSIASACLYVTRKQYWQDMELYFANVVHEDENVLVPLVAKAKSVVITRQVLFHRRLRAGSIMTRSATPVHLAGRAYNVRQVLAQMKMVPPAQRPMLRTRCEVFGKMYLRLAEELGLRPRAILLLRALVASQSHSFYRKIKKYIKRRLRNRLALGGAK